jgi:DNA-directed RNA polymerase specialized sigma24 family protein
MPIEESSRQQSGKPDLNSMDESSLVALLAQGDEEALRILMDRFDQLVRYTIFRTAREQTARDPQWLDAVAGETWSGFLKTVRRGTAIKSGSVAGYLTGVARQQTISALRRLRAFAGQRQSASDLDAVSNVPGANVDATSLLGELESLTALRDCAALLPEEDRVIMTQLQAITQRRWVEAGAALGLSESTLRSRWGKIIDRLRACMEKKDK